VPPLANPPPFMWYAPGALLPYLSWKLKPCAFGAAAVTGGGSVVAFVATRAVGGAGSA